MTLCVMNYCFTISELIMVQWEDMKDAGFVPQAAKGVQHEARNSIRLCTLHHRLFDAHCYYIRWMPEVVFQSLKPRLFLPHRRKGALF